MISLAELNCENLFDVKHDEMKQDIEYTPKGSRHWTFERFKAKVENIQQALLSCLSDNGESLPDLIALCEVENDYVLKTLTTKYKFKKRGYRYVMTTSPDLRGIDVALMYNPQTFKPYNQRTVRIDCLEGMKLTRDLLCISGKTVNEDTIHVIVAHAPSMTGGKKATDPFREHVSNEINNIIDSIRHININANIIVTGDFNATQKDESVKMIIRNDMHDISEDAEGENGAMATYKYRGRWQKIDHIIVSTPLKNNLRGCYINDAPFLLEEDSKGGVKPKRTFLGYKYNGGYSDHLPVVAIFDL